MSPNVNLPAPTPYPTLPSNLAPNQLSRSQFSTLPLELRQKIWSLTFTPRTLQLHIHRSFAPILGPVTQDSSNGMRGFYIQAPTSISFTATDISRIKNPASRSWHDENPNVSCKDIPVPPGPVALFVCHESRLLALKSYHLSFGGTNHRLDGGAGDEEWQQGHYGEKRIWINFQLDTIFISCLTCVGYIGCPLRLLSTFVPEEARKIREILVGANWQVMAWQNGPHYTFVLVDRDPGSRESFDRARWAPMGTNLQAFERLQTLGLCEMGYLDYESGLRTRDEEHRLGDQEVVNFVRAKLEEARRRQVEWTRELPEIVVGDFESLLKD